MIHILSTYNDSPDIIAVYDIPDSTDVASSHLQHLCNLYNEALNEKGRYIITYTQPYLQGIPSIILSSKVKRIKGEAKVLRTILKQWPLKTFIEDILCCLPIKYMEHDI